MKLNLSKSGIGIIKITPRPGNTELVCSGDSLNLWGGGASLALVCGSSRDNVLIKKQRNTGLVPSGVSLMKRSNLF